MSVPPPFQPYPTRPDDPYRSDSIRPVAGLRTATLVLFYAFIASLVLLPIVGGLAVVSTFGGLDQGAVSNSAGVRAAATVGILLGLVGLVGVATAALWFVWVWRVRMNAEAIAGPQSQRLSRGWTFWSWFCPVVNYWFPYQIMVDAYRASSPYPGDSGGIVLRWWVTWFIGAGLELIATVSNSYSFKLLAGLVEVVVFVLCAVWVSQIILRITAWQEARRTGASQPGMPLPGQQL